MEYWTDTEWEAYKEVIQEEIRGQMDSDGADLKAGLELEIDLDDGNEDWMYTAHFFPLRQVPANIVDPWKKKMMEKANDENLFTKHSNIWICGYQSHKIKKKIRLIRFILNNTHMDQDESLEEDGHGSDHDSSDSSSSHVSQADYGEEEEEKPKKKKKKKNKTVSFHEPAREKKGPAFQCQ